MVIMSRIGAFLMVGAAPKVETKPFSDTLWLKYTRP